MRVVIESKKWIKPANPTPSHLQRHQLSLIDQLHPLVYIPAAFHFDNNNNEKTVNDRLGRLEESLSKVLTLYYPFAGRYDDEDGVIRCEDQGLEFVVANVVDCKLHQLVDGQYDGQLLLCGLEKTTPDVAYAPMVSIQVNVFSCGGLVIGTRSFHKVGDMPTFFTFVNAWATTCRLGTLHQVSPPSFNVSSLFPPRRDYHLIKPPPSTPITKPPPSNYVMKHFIFTGETLSKLKSTVIDNYTRVELVTTIITISLINIERSRQVTRPLLVCQSLSLRPRIKIEQNLSGNLMIRVMSGLDVENNEWSDFWEVARVIRDSIRNFDSEIRNAGEDWSEINKKVEKIIVEFSEQGKKGEEKVNMVRFTSWCRFPLNNVDFGWGVPSSVSVISLPFSYIALMDYKSDDGGIVAGVCLKEQDMARFQHQPDILAYAVSPHHPPIRSNM